MCTVPRNIRRHPRSWEKEREGLGVGAMTAGLPGACGGMVYPELCSHWAEVDVSESGSLYPQATEALRHKYLQVGTCLRSREH